MKKFITISLLFVIGFSIMHEYLYVAYDNNEHCMSVENTIEMQSSHEEFCDTHCEYHQSYLLSQKLSLTNVYFKSITNKIYKEIYNFKTNLEFYKPPIS